MDLHRARPLAAAAGRDVTARIVCWPTCSAWEKDCVKFSPDYVRIVLNENFEDAKAQFLVPLMAIEYAHLVMLAEQKIVVARRGGARSGRRSTASRSDDDPQGRIRRHLRGSLLLHRAARRRRLRRGRRRPAAHGALPQRHRHDDVPHVAAAADPRGDRRRRWRCGARSSRWPTATARRCSPRTRTRSRRSRRRSRTTCRPSSSSSSATPCG